MATESAAPLLQKIRSQLLEVAGSNPSATESALTQLPTLEELVANSGSGHFRCHKCKAALLLGPNSQICAACGTRREEVASSFSISFASTLAYQLLMSSLQPEESVATGKSTSHIEESLQIQQKEPKDGQIACDILNLVLKWPEDSVRSEQKTHVTQAANAHIPQRLGVDLEDFFGQSKLQTVAQLGKEVSTSTDQIQDVKWHASADSVPQVSGNESHGDLFSSEAEITNTQTYTGDNDPFLSWDGDVNSANSTHINSVAKNLHARGSPSAVHPLNLTGERTDWVLDSHFALQDNDLFADSVSNTEHGMPMHESWIQDDHWSVSTTKEPQKGSAEDLNENSTLQLSWPETFHSTDNQDAVSSSIWQQGGILQHDSTIEGSSTLMAGTNRMGDFDDLFLSAPAAQVLKLDKDITTTNTTLTEVDIFSGVKDKVDMPKRSSNDNSKHIMESLLSEMHDISFMLADHLVIPDKNIEHTIRL